MITRIQSDDAYIGNSCSGNPYIGVTYSHDDYSDDGYSGNGEHLAGSSGASIIRPPQNSTRPGARGQIRIASEREAESPEPEAKSQLGGEPEEVFQMNNGEVCARAHLDRIIDLVEAYDIAVETGEVSLDDGLFDDASVGNLIMSHPLEVMTSSEWDKTKGRLVPRKYCLLLQEFPRVRIVGELDGRSDPVTAYVQFQEQDKWRVLPTTPNEITSLFMFLYHFYPVD